MTSNDTRLSCQRCGSTDVIPKARVVDRGDYGADFGNIRIGVARKPHAAFFKGLEHADVWARVCGECGFVELFVDDARAIYRAYTDSRRADQA